MQEIPDIFLIAIVVVPGIAALIARSFVIGHYQGKPGMRFGAILFSVTGALMALATFPVIKYAPFLIFLPCAGGAVFLLYGSCFFATFETPKDGS